MHPIDPEILRSHELPISFRGYAREQTDALLTRVAQACEEWMRECRQLREEVNALEAKVSAYAAREEALREQEMRAQENAHALLESAEQKSRALLEKASQNAAEIRRGEEEAIAQLQQELERLSQQKRTAVEKLKAFVIAQQQLLTFYEEETDSPATSFTVIPRKSADEFQRLMFDEDE